MAWFRLGIWKIPSLGGYRGCMLRMGANTIYCWNSQKCTGGQKSSWTTNGHILTKKKHSANTHCQKSHLTLKFRQGHIQHKMSMGKPGEERTT
jgi:hypothetical protein